MDSQEKLPENVLNSSSPQVASNAASYKPPLNSQINPRTGVLQVNLSPPPLAGFLGANITPSIFYQHSSLASGNHMLGLPLGWSYPFSFISEDRVFIHGQQSYFIDSSSASGLGYYKLKNLFFKICPDKPFPYDSTQKYGDILQFQDGITQYFDTNGRLLGMDDRFKNHVLFYYDGEGDVYNSKLQKIINSYGQEITFTYDEASDKPGITIAYPKGANDSVTFKYVTDKNNLYLTEYIDPIGNHTKIINNGGIVRKDLISEIDYPNGTKATYVYTSLMYKTPTDYAIFDAVCSSVHESYKDQTRSITYNYNPYPDYPDHNYTGYPLYGGDGKADALLESVDNAFRYITSVDDGIFVTDHIYNFLHLELERKIFTKDNLTAPINHSFYHYKGEDQDKCEDQEVCFPDYNSLPLNYQTPTSIVTEVYNDQNQKRTYKVESELDEYGQPTHVKSYKSITTNNDFILKNETITTYDKTTYDNKDDKYGEILQQDIYDYQVDSQSTAPTSAPIMRRFINDLTDDGKSIRQTTEGFVNGGTFVPSKKISYEYDDSGRVTSEKLEWADGNPHDLPSTQRTITYTYSSSILTTSITNAQGKITVVQAEAATGWIINQTNPLNFKVSFAYDNLGRKISATDPLNVTTKWIYDDINSKVTTQYVNGYQTFLWFDGFGNLIKKSDNLGLNGNERVTLTQTYNPQGQLIGQEGILGSNSSIFYTYNKRGELETERDALGNIKRYEYDCVAQTQKNYFNSNEQPIKQPIKEQQLNDKYMVIQEEICSATSSEKLDATASYNSFNKTLTKTIGNKLSQQLWQESHYMYDSSLNLSTSHTIGSDNITADRLITRDLFANPIQNEIKITSPDGKQNSTKSDIFNYNSLNQLIEENNPLSQHYQYTYNDAGMLETSTDYAGTVFSYTYYPNNLLETRSYTDASGKKYVNKYTYDPQAYTLLSLEAFRDSVSQGKMEYSYTLDGKVKTATYPDGKTVVISYDEQKGQVKGFTDALGDVTIYSYDDYGRLKSTQIGKDYTASITYYSLQEDPSQSGKIKSILLNNGMERRYKYDGYGNTTNLTILASSNVMLSVDYTYEPTLQNISKITYSSSLYPDDPSLNYSEAYEYNSLNQLTVETRYDAAQLTVSTTSYAYSAANNISQITVTTGETKTVTTYQYDADNKLTQIVTPSRSSTLSYDTNGNLIDDGEDHYFTYNELNQLIGYEDKNNNVKALYTYYSNGLRKSKQLLGSAPIFFYYDEAKTPNVINEIQGDQSSSYLKIGSQRYIRFLHKGQDIVPQYYIQNYKDTLAVIDKDSKVDKSYTYDAYGQTKESPPASSVTIEHNPFQYCSEYTDEESGLTYLRSRYYNSRIKRFISRDRALLINRYNYVESNPIIFIDPTGRFAEAGAVMSETATEAGETALPLLTIPGVGEVALAAAAVVTAIFSFLELIHSAKAHSGSGKRTKGGNPNNSSTTNPALTHQQAGDLFRQSNPGTSSTLSDPQLRAIDIAYPELNLQIGLRGGRPPGRRDRWQEDIDASGRRWHPLYSDNTDTPSFWWNVQRGQAISGTDHITMGNHWFNENVVELNFHITEPSDRIPDDSRIYYMLVVERHNNEYNYGIVRTGVRNGNNPINRLYPPNSLDLDDYADSLALDFAKALIDGRDLWWRRR